MSSQYTAGDLPRQQSDFEPISHKQSIRSVNNCSSSIESRVFDQSPKVDSNQFHIGFNLNLKKNYPRFPKRKVAKYRAELLRSCESSVCLDSKSIPINWTSRGYKQNDSTHTHSIQKSPVTIPSYKLLRSGYIIAKKNLARIFIKFRTRIWHGKGTNSIHFQIIQLNTL